MIYISTQQGVTPQVTPLAQKMVKLLAGYQDIMLRDDLPPQLPLVQPEDHKIELLPGSDPPSKFPYRLSKALEGKLEQQLLQLL